MPETLHLFVTNEGDDGWSAESPQLPGFVMGRATLAELRADLPGALRFAGASSNQIQVHRVNRFDTPDGNEYLIRVAEDTYRGDRLEVAWRLLAVMTTEQRRDLLAVPNATGEASFICAVASDRLSWFIEQLYDKDDTVTVCAGVADEGVFSIRMSSDMSHLAAGWASPAERGWSENTTFGQLMRDAVAGGPGAQLLIER